MAHTASDGRLPRADGENARRVLQLLVWRCTPGSSETSRKRGAEDVTYLTISPLQILGAVDLVDPDENAHFLSRCQFKFGGIAKVPNDRPGA